MKRFIFLLALVASACGRDDGDIDELIGSACTSDRDCDSRCYLDSGKFPGGFCSLSCSNDNDCPSDAYCASTEGGVCLFSCPPFDCTRLGPQWACKERSHQTGGNVFVCIGD